MSEVFVTDPDEVDSAIKQVQLPTRAVGRSSKKRQDAVKELVHQMQFETRKGPDGKIEGPLRPCTIVNFNPIDLVVQGQLRLTIPKPGTTKHHQIRLDWRGRQMVGHYCYVASPIEGDSRKPDKEPVYYTTVTGHEQDEILGIDVPKADPRVFTPHSIACEVWSQYNSASLKLMGGILMFDQDPLRLTRANLEASGRRIWVPERTQLPNSWRYSYTLRETILEDELDRIFETQQKYIEVILQQAHTWFMDEDTNSRKMITDTHREWARYAKDKGYLVTLPEWVTARLATAEHVGTLVVCPYCGQQQPKPDIYFCKNGHPFDTYKAFMAGLAVGDAYIEMLNGEQLEEVLRIRAERRARMRGDTPSPEPEPKPTGRSTKKAAPDEGK